MTSRTDLRDVSLRLRNVSLRLRNVSLRLRNLSCRLRNVSFCCRWCCVGGTAEAQGAEGGTGE